MSDSDDKPKTAPVGLPKLEEPSGGSDSDFHVQNMELKAYAKHVVLWKQPKTTVKYLVALLMITYGTSEFGSNYSFIGLFATYFVGRATLLFVFNGLFDLMASAENSIVKTSGEKLKGFFAKVVEHTALPSADTVTYFISGISDLLESKALSALSALKEAEASPRLLKVVVGHYVALMALVSLFNIGFLITAGCFVALTVPGIYSRHYEKIDPVLEKAKSKIEPIAKKMEEKGHAIGESVAQKMGKLKTKVENKVHDLRNKAAKKTN